MAFTDQALRRVFQKALMKKPRFHVEVTTEAQPEVRHTAANGYGQGSVTTMLTGRPKDVTIVMDGSPVFSLGIDKDGNLSITNCYGMFEHLFGTSIRLKNTRPWTAKS